ncbi:MAG: diaminopimelate epimerase [Chloroflexi bacterium]|nr:diaminopimelate epimerase [Chloroflexota bacterium]
MNFTKLHGTGNDFVLLDARSLDRDWGALAQSICDRHFGVGGDGLILAAPSERAPVRMRIFNADGSEAEMSGNGMRCLVKFAVDQGIVMPEGDEFDVETGAGVLRVCIVTERGLVTGVRESMGPPRLDPREIPVAIDAPPPIKEFEVQVDGRTLAVTPVSMGNPHAVHFQDAPVAAYPLHNVGPLMEHHALFPKRTNFEVVRMLGRDRAEMRVWERGVGETLSCGSGASATMVAARLLDLADGALELRVPGGVLNLEWDGEGDVILTGPVVEVFRGTWPD